jgi:hypothetical protein
LRNWWRVAVDVDGGKRSDATVKEETHAPHGKVYSLQSLQSQTSLTRVQSWTVSPRSPRASAMPFMR